MSSTIDDYFAALERLIKNKPLRIPKGYVINNDNVALEAGRTKGSIKRSRAVFHDLIERIKQVKDCQVSPTLEFKRTIENQKQKLKRYKLDNEAQFKRELMLLDEIRGKDGNILSFDIMQKK